MPEEFKPIEAYSDGVTIKIPLREVSEEDMHNCDANGCSSISHVRSFDLKEVPNGMAQKVSCRGDIKMKYAYAGIKPCGCLVAATVDSPENTDCSNDVKEFLDAGLKVERRVVSDVRELFTTCKHKEIPR